LIYQSALIYCGGVGRPRLRRSQPGSSSARAPTRTYPAFGGTADGIDQRVDLLMAHHADTDARESTHERRALAGGSASFAGASTEHRVTTSRRTPPRRAHQGSGPYRRTEVRVETMAIYAEAVTNRFGSIEALNGVDLSVPPGAVLGLLGPNGSGKTTAVRILTTVLRPDAGRAEILGHDVITHAQAVRNRIGLAGQNAAVDENLTGNENLLMIGRLAHQARAGLQTRAEELLERFQLAEAANRPVKTYSGGMRRRLDLAAALVHRPPVLILDEPTTGLDPRGRLDLWCVIEQLVADGATLLLTTPAP
jgi:ABC-type Na+ transport system ATPase subunit NatA